MKTLRLFLMLIFLLLIHAVSFSQNFISVKQFGRIDTSGSYQSSVRDIKMTTDYSGNIYLTGAFIDTVDFDPGPGVYNLMTDFNPDAFLVKLDSQGNFVWARQIKGNSLEFGQCISIDITGNVFLTGFFDGTADFDPNAGIYNLYASSNSKDIFVLKLNSSGVFQWAFKLGSTTDEGLAAITVDFTGSVYVTGPLNFTMDFDPGAGTLNLTSAGWSDVFIACYSSSGSFLWADKIGGINNEGITGITTDFNGFLYVNGTFYGTVDFDPGPGVFNMTSPQLVPNIFMLKLTTSGAFVWAKKFSSNIFSISTALDVDGFGHIYISGYFGDSLDVDPGPGTYNLISTGTQNSFVAKLDTTGNLLMVTQLCGTNTTQIYDIQFDQVGCIYATGIYDDTLDLDPGPGILTSVCNAYIDFFLVKINTYGNFEWGYSFGGSSVDNAFSVCLDLNNNILVAGNFDDTVDFDPGPGIYNLNCENVLDMYLLKLTNTISTNTNYINNVDDDVRMFPNPGNEKTYIEANQIMHEIYLYNMAGQMVFKSSPNTSRYALNYSTPGIFSVQIITADKTIVKRLMIVD